MSKISGKRYTHIPHGIKCLLRESYIDCKLMQGGVDVDVFYEFVEKFLLPHLMPFDGHNPHSVVVLDNCAIHHINSTVQMIHDTGALIHFLPPYSPDYNPIESMFSKLKTVMKGIDQVYLFVDLKTVILTALSSVTRHDC